MLYWGQWYLSFGDLLVVVKICGCFACIYVHRAMLKHGIRGPPPTEHYFYWVQNLHKTAEVEQLSGNNTSLCIKSGSFINRDFHFGNNEACFHLPDISFDFFHLNCCVFSGKCSKSSNAFLMWDILLDPQCFLSPPLDVMNGCGRGPREFLVTSAHLPLSCDSVIWLLCIKWNFKFFPTGLLCLLEIVLKYVQVWLKLFNSTGSTAGSINTNAFCMAKHCCKLCNFNWNSSQDLSFQRNNLGQWVKKKNI